jgi:hypothetical protein
MSFTVNELTSDERRWSAKARELETEALPNIRGTAEKWAAAITGSLGVVGLAALLNGPEAFNELDGWHKDGAEWCFVGAAVAALIATLLATLAAQSEVTNLQASSGTAYRDWARGQISSAGRALKWSRWLAAAAAALVLASAAFLWFGDTKAPSATVIDAQGTALCTSSSPSEPQIADATYVIRCSP